MVQTLKAGTSNFQQENRKKANSSWGYSGKADNPTGRRYQKIGKKRGQIMLINLKNEILWHDNHVMVLKQLSYIYSHKNTH